MVKGFFVPLFCFYVVCSSIFAFDIINAGNRYTIWSSSRSYSIFAVPIKQWSFWSSSSYSRVL